ncbi:MAG: peptidoglycan DD-metalloendopeptidase family protein [Candidatus Binatia bacterium]
MQKRQGFVERLLPSLKALVALVCILLLLPAPAVARRKQAPRGTKRHPTRKPSGPRAKRLPLPHRRATRAFDGDALRAGRVPAEEHVHVRRGDTFESILAARGVGAAEALPWFEAAAQVYDLRRVRPRRGVTLEFDRASRDLQAIKYEIDDRTLLVVESSDIGIRAYRTSLPYVLEVKGVAGRITRGLREDAREAGVPPRIVSELADIFGWDVDVENGLQEGDEFRVLYENLWQVGLGRGEPGKVMGASIVRQGEPITAVYFEDDDGRGGYYQPSGKPLSRAFLRYPVDFTEISSEFSLLRLHPILHRERPHLGVDFAAPRGTPVRAAASGRVSYAGWARGLGRCVRIGHSDAITSTYGHLAGIVPNLEVGSSVERGQVIGYVGATGLATGPHLHYALDHEGEYVDPLALHPGTDQAVPSSAHRMFDKVEAEVVRQLEALPATSTPQTVTLSRAAYPSAAFRAE